VRVVAVDTLRLEEFGNLLLVRVRTDEGLSGLGETFFGPRAFEAYVHETAAPYLLGRDPLDVEAHAHALRGHLGYSGTGAETRGRSAVDIALWDLLGKATGQPLYRLLGGRAHDRVRLYNTCAGPGYIRSGGQSTANWGLPRDDPGTTPGRYEDLDAFLHRAGELALDLREQGVTGMKIWPFDPYAEAGAGTYLSARQLAEGLRPFELIREAVGDDMDVMLEFHSLWDLPAARRIARAVEDYRPFWFEDPVRADDLDALAAFAAGTRVPVAASETLGGRRAFRELLSRRAAGVVMLDVSWCGGLGEARAIAGMAAAHSLPVTPHDCTGPVVLTASTHLAVHAPNTLVAEFVRASYHGWYRELLTQLPPVVDGHIAPPPGPGLGTDLQPDVWRRPDAVARTSGAAPAYT
jgi:galactonate dehydratase